MTAQHDFESREAPMNMRDKMLMDEGNRDPVNALYQSAYEPGPNGRFKSDCFPRNFPRNLPDFNNGDLDFPRCWPLPGLDDSKKPTETQETKAETALDKGINGLIPDADQQNLKDANHALLTGDTASLSNVYEKYKDDPAKLKAFVEEQNRELKDAKSDVGVQMTDDGKIFISKDHGMSAVSIDPSTGEATVRKVMHDSNGDIYVGDKVDNADPQKALERIGNHAVNDINEPDIPIWFGLQHERMKGFFRNAVLMSAQATPELSPIVYDSNQSPPNPQVATA
ncbi:MAG TPA: hypothetical protein V6C89_01930 [Drouetiella sp.]|jgi:hypothetical protein